MGHQYSRHSDHIRRLTRPAPENAAVDEHLRSLLSSAVYSQQAYYRTLGMRDRILTLPLMVAAVVTPLWRQVQLTARWAQQQRPIPASVVYARQHFEQIWAADGSVL